MASRPEAKDDAGNKFAPHLLLPVLTCINLFNYIDRYLLAAVLPSVQASLFLTNGEAGMLGSVFMVGYMLSSPIFGYFGDRGGRIPRKVLIALGVCLWSLATCLSGLAVTFLGLLLLRACVGVGEASYAALAPPWIDDYSTPETRNRRLSIFYVAIPVGAALGYLLGGFLEARIGWRSAFIVAGLPGFLLALGLLSLRDGRKDKSTLSQEPFGPLLQQLCRNRIYVFLVAGYTAYTFSLGGFAYWAPHYVSSVLAFPLEKANLWFGALTVTTGLLGTLGGGQIGTVAFQRWGQKGTRTFLAITTGFSVPFAILSLTSSSATGFFVFAFFCELFLFASTGPINAAIFGAVEQHQRAFALSISTLAIHLFGDLWSPTIIGVTADHSTLRAGMAWVPVFLLLATLLWSLSPAPKSKST